MTSQKCNILELMFLCKVLSVFWCGDLHRGALTTELRQTFCMNEQLKNPQNKQCSFPHFVSSKLNFMRSFSFSTVDSVTLDSMVEFWQQSSMSDLSGGATISSPSSNARDSSSSVTTTNIKQKQDTEHCYQSSSVSENGRFK